jgi:hypothetical protein
MSITLNSNKSRDATPQQNNMILAANTVSPQHSVFENYNNHSTLRADRINLDEPKEKHVPVTRPTAFLLILLAANTVSPQQSVFEK